MLQRPVLSHCSVASTYMSPKVIDNDLHREIWEQGHDGNALPVLLLVECIRNHGICGTHPAPFLLVPDSELIESGRRKPFIALASALFILAMLAALLLNLAKTTCSKRCGGQILRTNFAIKHLWCAL